MLCALNGLLMGLQLAMHVLKKEAECINLPLSTSLHGVVIAYHRQALHSASQLQPILGQKRNAAYNS